MSGVLRYLEHPPKLDSVAASSGWQERQKRFSAFVSGIGWNTFDYIRHDLRHARCLLLCKLDSNNERFMEKALGINMAPSRGKYPQSLADCGIFGRYPAVVVNIAIYAFTSLYCLGSLRRLDREDDSNFALECG